MVTKKKQTKRLEIITVKIGKAEQYSFVIQKDGTLKPQIRR